jgi:S-adenosylmethionine-diacylglycerol 3-amino-3-carboxypropyl transferase
MGHALQAEQGNQTQDFRPRPAMSFQYFNGLNYTLGNEDTSLELKLLPAKTGHVFSVAGSGSRVLPLLAKHPKQVTCVDLSNEQLYLTELRIESARCLEHSEFVAFWGYPPRSAERNERRVLFGRIELSTAADQFCRGLLEAKEWESILYEGRWEKTIARLSRINERITGKKGARLFDARTRSEHFNYLKEKFPWNAWAVLLYLLGNAVVFNALLYKGHFPRKNIPGSMSKFYLRALNRLFAKGPARRNFFLQLLFFGKIRFSEGNPVECDPMIFSEVKKGLAQTEIHYRLGDAIGEAQKVPEAIDYFSFSDVPSYFSGRVERTFLQQIWPRLAPKSLVVWRNYLHVPEETDTSGYENVRGYYRRAIDHEKVQMYLVDVYRRSA